MQTLKRITVLMAIMSFIVYQGFSQNAPVTGTQKNSKNTQTPANLTPGKFIDTNNDGVCDNYQARMKNGRGVNFVDKNGDGICDNRQNAGQGKGNPNGCGMGYQHRHGRGQGNCCGGGYGYQNRHGRGNQNAPAPEPRKSNDKK
ncbi:MAG: hypothetical protein NTX61_09115 [Bacteroidetes bacterium]|nr:hypothetical protein [Bacteroidota bacterium]